MRRLLDIYDQNGIWSIYFIFKLATNRLNVFFIRLLLHSNDVYFQGTPRVIGRRRVRFGRNFQCGRGAWIEALPATDQSPSRDHAIIFGDNITVSENFHIAAAHSVSIGDNVLIGSGVLITDHSHGRYGTVEADLPATPPNQRPLTVRGAVHVGSNVWLGDNVKILSGVTIGEGAVIAAGTVVRQNVPAACVYGMPIPAAVLRVYDVDTHGWREVKDTH